MTTWGDMRGLGVENPILSILVTLGYVHLQTFINKENFIDITKQLLVMNINGIGRQALKNWKLVVSLASTY